jgi:hypothetical protein
MHPRATKAGGINYLKSIPGLVKRLQIRAQHIDSATRFSTSGFLHGSVSPKPLILPIGPFRIFSKIHGNIHSQDATSTTQVANGKSLKSEKFSFISYGHLRVLELAYR